MIDCDEVMESLEHVINWKKEMKCEKKNRGVKTFHRLPVVSPVHMHRARALVCQLLLDRAR